jgi:hypothetical protein
MSITHKSYLQEQIETIVQHLSTEKQQKILEYAQSLQQDALFQNWDDISDQEAEALKAEFAQEDIDFSEAIMTDFKSQLEQEDKQ